MPTSPKPPIAKIEPRIDVIHGDRRIDNYYWLRDRTNPEVIAYLEAENRYTEAMMQPTEVFREQLYREMLGRIKETDSTVPEKEEDYFYYSRTEEGKAYRIHCRKHGSPDAPEEILLDENELAAGHDYLEVGVFKVSPDHRLLAYSMDTSGAEMFSLFVKDLDSGELLPDQIGNTYYDLEWTADGRTFFYTTLDEAKRPYKVYRHTLGDDPATDPEITHEEDERFFLSLAKTRSKAYLLLEARSKTTTEIRVLPADQPEGTFQMVQPRQQGLEYSLDHHEEEFFILTNDQAQNFKVMRAPVAAPGRENWQELVPHRPDIRINRLAAFREYLALVEREAGLPKIRTIHLASGDSRPITFPEPAYNCWLLGNREYDTHRLRFGYTSLVTPESIFDYNMATGKRELKKQQEVPGGYNPADYKTERIFAKGLDGAAVPISLVYKKGLVKDGRNPLLLYAYGSYEASVYPRFAPERLSLLERGMVYAIAHIRGGGEMGRPWYERGKLLHKRNTFTDFIACANRLIEQRYTSPDRLAILGGSAGGLLMGAVVNMRPELFKVVVARVPFVDAINTMLDPSIPLTTAEYEEWGNPADPVFYDYIRSYSPYDNVEARAYPDILVTAGLNDPRVQYWEPAKWTARLRAFKTDQNLLLLKTNMAAGHGGPSDRYEYLKETAFVFTFILDRLGLRE